MKTEFADVNDTRKNLRVEIPSDVVDAEIDRVALTYSRRARVPGFRPGKAPARVIKQRYKEQILHDVAHDLVPRAIDDALRERGVEPIDTPDVRDVVINEGQPMTFTASFDIVPPFEPGDYSTVLLRRRSARVEDEAVVQALERLRQRAARYEPVEGRAVSWGDSVVVDLERHNAGGRGPMQDKETRPPDSPEKHENVRIELGAKANPPGLDEQLLGLDVAATKSFSLHYPEDHAIKELANLDIGYTVTVKAIQNRVVPELDDELAKDLGDFDTLDALRARVRADLEHEAGHEADRQVRADLMKQLAAWVPFDVPESLIEREVDRRIEEFAGRLMAQNIDPQQAGIDWGAFRDSQRDVAREAVAAALVLDEVARREQLDPTDEEVEREVNRYAEQTGRTAPAARARLEKEGGLSRVRASLRREKSIDFVMARGTISGEA